MNDPFTRGQQALTDALLQIDRNIALAESSVAAALQLGLPEAPTMAARLPALVLHARQFLATVPDMGQPQRWGEARRLLDQARSYDTLFAPYLILGQRVAAAKQATADHIQRTRAAEEAARRSRREAETGAKLQEARRRFSLGRQMLADMGLRRGPGYEDPAWHEAVRTLASILAAQDVRLGGASASIRDGDFDQAESQLDQTLGELQGGTDMAQRAWAVAAASATPTQPGVQGITIPMPHLNPREPVREAGPSLPRAPMPAPLTRQVPRAVSLIETRTGTLFRCEVDSATIGRGLDSPRVANDKSAYLDLSRACDTGEAEYLGVSRRHAEIRREASGWAIIDLESTNGTRVRHKGQTAWTELAPRQPYSLAEGDALQFGLLEVVVAFS
ncbi:MAG TPA: FHA domain-containing protein [Chloroflexota bacterium]|nr:FHA domain-containing protein [Chloroflexota bacterium]